MNISPVDEENKAFLRKLVDDYEKDIPIPVKDVENLIFFIRETYPRKDFLDTTYTFDGEQLSLRSIANELNQLTSYYSGYVKKFDSLFSNHSTEPEADIANPKYHHHPRNEARRLYRLLRIADYITTENWKTIHQEEQKKKKQELLSNEKYAEQYRQKETERVRAEKNLYQINLAKAAAEISKFKSFKFYYTSIKALLITFIILLIVSIILLLTGKSSKIALALGILGLFISFACVPLVIYTRIQINKKKDIRDSFKELATHT